MIDSPFDPSAPGDQPPFLEPDAVLIWQMHGSRVGQWAQAYLVDRRPGRCLVRFPTSAFGRPPAESFPTIEAAMTRIVQQKARYVALGWTEREL